MIHDITCTYKCTLLLKTKAQKHLNIQTSLQMAVDCTLASSWMPYKNQIRKRNFNLTTRWEPNSGKTWEIGTFSGVGMMEISASAAPNTSTSSDTSRWSTCLVSFYIETNLWEQSRLSVKWSRSSKPNPGSTALGKWIYLKLEKKNISFEGFFRSRC